MTLQAINNVIMKLHQDLRPPTDQERPQFTQKSFMPVSYTTADGGLFVGYYLNIHG